MSFRDQFKEYQLQWLAWMIIVLATLAISLFFGVNYPVPEQPTSPSRMGAIPETTPARGPRSAPSTR